jgi:hypothetical protein
LISLCEEHSGGVDCKIFAFDRGIVWKGPITYPGTRPDNIGVKGDAAVHGKTTVVSTVAEFSSAELEKLASTIEKERLKIVEYLGSGGNRKFHYEIGTTTYITTWRCRQTVEVNITPYHVKNNIVPISNPIASCLIGSGFNSLLTIGFYTYAQDRFGSNKAFPNYGVDLHRKSGNLLVRSDYESLKDKPLHISSEIFRAMGKRGRSKNERTAARIFAASFSKYLIEDVLGDDIERFKRIYMTGDFLKEAKLSFAELEKQWSEHVMKSRPAEPVMPLTSIKGILRAKGLSDLEAFQEAKNYIGTKCLDNFERHEERHSSGLETAFAYAQDRMAGPYTCGGGYSMYTATAKDNALSYCEKGREKHGITAPCEILAIGNKIVWEGETVRSK